MALTVHSLTCEYQNEALGVGVHDPVVGWKLSSAENGARQTAYRAVVSDEDGNTVWDSGKTASDRQFGIVIPREAGLKPMAEYSFCVTVWDENDAPSPAVSSRFVTGFFKSHQWRGDWLRIWHYGDVRCFRREFELKNAGAIKYAYAFIGAFGDKGNSCVSFLNGERLGGLVCFPGACESFVAQYACVDVKRLLKEGKNAVALMLARTASILIKVKYNDDSEVFVECKRDEWKMKPGCRKLGYPESMQHGKAEECDARLDFPGWTEPGFDDSDWEPAGEPTPCIDLSPLFLRPHYRPAEIREQLNPISITGIGGGILADFGTNLAGFAGFRLKGAPGETVELRYAEKLDDNGAPVFSDWRGAYCKYTFATDEIEEFIPCFSYTGFRYVGVFGYSGDIGADALTAYRIHSGVENASRFDCSDSDINVICKTAQGSFLSNLVNIPTDCPERERRGWTADAYAVCEAECVSLDVHTLYAQWLESVRDCRRGNGWIPVELPLSSDDCIDVNWPAAAVIVPFTIYGQYGDERLIKRLMPTMKAWVSLLEELCDDDYTLSERYMSYKDWIAADPASPRFLSGAYFYRCADLLAQLCAAAGDACEAERCSALAARIRESVNEEYLHITSDGAYYDGGSQSANAHALCFGICPEEHRQAVTECLVHDIERRGTSTCGFMGSSCLLEALSQNGRSDVAYRLLKNRREGGWLYLIERFGATTFPEHFNGGGSQNHAFLGSAPALWARKRLVGIRTEAPAYKHVRFEPFIPDGMENASATVDTPFGEVSAGWQKRSDGIELSVKLPPNTSGTVVFGGKTQEIASGTHTFRF